MINVTAAIIQREGRILIAKRSSTSSLPNKWKFPGGKVEPGETQEECLKRELREEFEIEVTTGSLFAESVYDYDHNSVRLLAYGVHTDENIRRGLIFLGFLNFGKENEKCRGKSFKP